jgi:hypothetical protein
MGFGNRVTRRGIREYGFADILCKHARGNIAYLGLIAQMVLNAGEGRFGVR